MSSIYPQKKVELPLPRDPDESAIVTAGGVVPIHYDLYFGREPALALIVPGFWRDRSHLGMRLFAMHLVNLGVHVAVVDIRGHGDSGGTYGFNRDEHLDVAAVAEDLITRHGLKRILLVGLSVGGAIAVSTVARHDLPFEGLLLISPVAEFSMITPHFNPLTLHRHIAFSQALKRPRFDWQFARSEKLSAAEDIAQVHIPLSLIHVVDDWLIGHRHSELLFENANEPKELHLLDIKGGFHADRIFEVAAAQTLPLVDSFVIRTLDLPRSAASDLAKETVGGASAVE